MPIHLDADHHIPGSRQPRSTTAATSSDYSPQPNTITGTIKWFDPSKGYGFIVPDNGLGDVHLHVTTLRAGGFTRALPDARVIADVMEGKKGLQAFRLLAMDETTAAKPTGTNANTHVRVSPETDWEKAKVKWFNRVRGFGFLTRGEGTPDIFTHMETVRSCGLPELRPNQPVLVRSGRGVKGVMAADIRAYAPEQAMGGLAE